jgi:hypothetical protein
MSSQIWLREWLMTIGRVLINGQRGLWTSKFENLRTIKCWENQNFQNFYFSLNLDNFESEFSRVFRIVLILYWLMLRFYENF